MESAIQLEKIRSMDIHHLPSTVVKSCILLHDFGLLEDEGCFGPFADVFTPQPLAEL